MTLIGTLATTIKAARRSAPDSVLREIGAPPPGNLPGPRALEGQCSRPGDDTEQLRDRIRASASDRESLHDKLIFTQFDPTGLERQKHYTRELSLRVRQLRKQVEDAHKEADGARKEQDRRNSALHVLSNKFRRKSSDARAEAQRSSSDVIQRGFQLERELQDLEELSAEANTELESLRTTGAAHDSLLDRLDQVYEAIFNGSSSPVQRDRDLQQPVIAARSAVQCAEQNIRIEDSVMDNLRLANTKYKSMVGPFSGMLGSSQWQGWTMSSGASGTFADEDGNMREILAVVGQGDACLEAARVRQPKIEAQPIAVDTEGTDPKHLFRKMVWDPAYLTRMEAYVMKMRRSESVLRGEIDNAYNRKRQAQEDLFSAERDVSLTRQKLVEDREALIRELCPSR